MKINQRRCNKCGEDRETSEFNKNATTTSGYQSQCRICSREYDVINAARIKERKRRYYLDNKERILKRQHEYAVKNKEVIKLRRKSQAVENNAYQKEYRKNNKDKILAYQRANKGKLNAKTAKRLACKIQRTHLG